MQKPADFDAYWERTMQELDRLPVAAELELNQLRSSPEVTIYNVRFTSIGPYRLFAYYAVPVGQGSFPVRVQIGGYQSVVTVPAGSPTGHWDGGNTARLALCYRGQRHSDKPYAAAFPGMLTDGIEDPQEYVWRGVVADCCRAVDFVCSRPEIDVSQITLTGNDLALMAAAFRSDRLAGVSAAPALFYRLEEALPRATAYPLEEFNDYLRLYPERREQVFRTLAYFEPLYFAPRVRCPVRLSGDSAWLEPLRRALGNQS
jgi:cephalosporin-C deacetylase